MSAPQAGWERPQRQALLQSSSSSSFSISFLPVEAVAALGNKVVESLRAQDPGEGEALLRGCSCGNSQLLHEELLLSPQC